MNKEQKEHLLAAAALAEHAEDFNMMHYGHSCGTPACVLGYATRLLDAPFYLCRDDFNGMMLASKATGATVNYFAPVVLEFFGVTAEEAEELFGTCGCGGAGTDGAKAAAYIRDFVARKEAGL